MLVSSVDTFHTAFDREASSLFNVKDAYNQTIVNATANDGFVAGGSPLNFGLSSGTFLLLPFMMFWILYPNWGATLYGEVRGAGDFRKVLRGMLGGLWVTIGLAVVFVLLASKTFGWDFFNASNVNYINYAYGYVTVPPTIPIWGYPPMLAAFLIDNHFVQMAIVVLFGAWFIGWAGTLWLSSTRMIFAAAFDRVLPEAAARVSDRGVPWIALLLIMVPGVIVSWLYAYQAGFSTLTLDASLVIAVTFFGTSFAATILPWWKPTCTTSPPSPATRSPACRSSASPGRSRRSSLAGSCTSGCRTPSTGSAYRQHPVDQVPGHRVRPRGSRVGPRPGLPALPGDRPRRHPRGDPGRVTAAARSGGRATSLPTGFFWARLQSRRALQPGARPARYHAPA